MRGHLSSCHNDKYGRINTSYRIKEINTNVCRTSVRLLAEKYVEAILEQCEIAQVPS